MSSSVSSVNEGFQILAISGQHLKLLDLKKTTFRVPITKFSIKDTEAILDLLKKYKPKHLEIFELQSCKKQV